MLNAKYALSSAVRAQTPQNVVKFAVNRSSFPDRSTAVRFATTSQSHGFHDALATPQLPSTPGESWSFPMDPLIEHLAYFQNAVARAKTSPSALFSNLTKSSETPEAESEETSKEEKDEEIVPKKDEKDDEPTPPEDIKNENETPDFTDNMSVIGTSGPAAIGGGNGGNNNNNNNNNNDDNDDDGSKVKKSKASSSSPYPPFLAIAMKDRPQLPGREFSINISDPKVKRTITEICSRLQPHFSLFHMKDPEMPDTDIIHDRSSVYDIGAHCYVIRSYEDGGNLRVLGRVMSRCRLEHLYTPEEQAASQGVAEEEDFPTSYLKDYGVSYAKVSKCVDEPYDEENPELRHLVAEVKAFFDIIDSKIPSKKVVIQRGMKLLDSPSQLADYIGSVSAAPASKIQELLQEFNVITRLRKALELFKVELKSYYLFVDATLQITNKAEEAQHKQFVKEYVKILQRYVNPEAPTSKAAKFDERIKHLKLTEEAMEAYVNERAKLESTQEHSSEIAVSEKYLDWLTSIPWGVFSKDQFNIKRAKEILDRDHYGLKDVKNRILEFLSLGKISGKVDGKILCLVGPPGTGKTSIAKSIAESLNRRYARIAMGGISDVHEVKGHRRTYIGSIPGRIIGALKQAKTSNPLLLIDEIDKLDLSKSGGASSAFLEILDPEQNNGFIDNYIDVKVDLSKVLFVCTANYLGNIPPPLRDRMEIIDVSGYTNNEKYEIVTKHLIPNAAKRAMLDQSHVELSPEAIKQLIEKYCRESGVRNLKKLITRAYSKAALKIVQQLEERGLIDEVKDAPESKLEQSDSKIVQEFKDLEASVRPELSESKVEPLAVPEDIKLEITSENLKDFVGPEVYKKTRLFDTPPAGVSTGLSYNSSGNGDALYIESIITNSISAGTGNAGLRVTGQLKDVMKESASIAYSFSKLFLAKHYPENRFFEAAEIHVHCPEGAVPKDGPSAGIAFTSSLISLALNEPLPPSIAMTGEVTLTGKVSAVGGIREKILGAKRYGYDTIILPRDIESELEEVPEEVKEGVKFVPVLQYEEVFETIFPNEDKQKYNATWKSEFAKRDEKKKSKK